MAVTNLFNWQADGIDNFTERMTQGLVSNLESIRDRLVTLEGHTPSGDGNGLGASDVNSYISTSLSQGSSVANSFTSQQLKITSTQVWQAVQFSGQPYAGAISHNSNEPSYVKLDINISGSQSGYSPDIEYYVLKFGSIPNAPLISFSNTANRVASGRVDIGSSAFVKLDDLVSASDYLYIVVRIRNNGESATVVVTIDNITFTEHGVLYDTAVALIKSVAGTLDSVLNTSIANSVAEVRSAVTTLASTTGGSISYNQTRLQALSEMLLSLSNSVTQIMADFSGHVVMFNSLQSVVNQLQASITSITSLLSNVALTFLLQSSVQNTQTDEVVPTDANSLLGTQYGVTSAEKFYILRTDYLSEVNFRAILVIARFLVVAFNVPANATGVLFRYQGYPLLRVSEGVIKAVVLVDAISASTRSEEQSLREANGALTMHVALGEVTASGATPVNSVRAFTTNLPRNNEGINFTAKLFFNGDLFTTHNITLAYGESKTTELITDNSLGASITLLTRYYENNSQVEISSTVRTDNGVVLAGYLEVSGRWTEVTNVPGQAESEREVTVGAVGNSFVFALDFSGSIISMITAGGSGVVNLNRAFSGDVDYSIKSSNTGSDIYYVGAGASIDGAAVSTLLTNARAGLIYLGMYHHKITSAQVLQLPGQLTVKDSDGLDINVGEEINRLKGDA